MLPRNPDLPSFGPTTFGRSIALLIYWKGENDGFYWYTWSPADVALPPKADIRYVPGALTKGLDILQCRGQGARLVSADHLGDERLRCQTRTDCTTA